jgi:hypothetical protein
MPHCFQTKTPHSFEQSWLCAGRFECLPAAARCVETLREIVLDDCACNTSLSDTVAVSLSREPLKIDASAFEDE